MQRKVLELYIRHFGKEPLSVEQLPASGSARSYFRLKTDDVDMIGTYNRNLIENRLFIDFTNHFAAKGLRVPQIFCVADDIETYIQQDLGNIMLLDIVEQGRVSESLNEETIHLYRKSLKELLRFQFIGHEGLDYSGCMPRPVFDKRCIMWDLNYFKYCYLRLQGADFSEQALENDFEMLSNVLCRESTNHFMFRDFQSRNIMVKEGEIWFIDYQGGRQGALAYDVASLLYDAIVNMPNVQREELLDYYIDELQAYQVIDRGVFRSNYYRFVLVRLLQAMGAFGLRGLHEKKQHFIDSIRPGLDNILSLFETGKFGNDYPEILRACRNARAMI